MLNELVVSVCTGRTKLRECLKIRAAGFKESARSTLNDGEYRVSSQLKSSAVDVKMRYAMTSSVPESIVKIRSTSTICQSVPVLIIAMVGMPLPGRSKVRMNR